MCVLQTYSVRRVEVGEKRSVYVTVAFAGVALMVAMLIGVVVIRRRSSRYPQHQVLPLLASAYRDLSIYIYILHLHTTAQCPDQASNV